MNLSRPHPLRLLFPSIADVIAREKLQPDRCTGRSTIQASNYLAKALENPYVVIPVRDHHGTDQSDHELTARINGLVRQIGLQKLVIDHIHKTIIFGEPAE